MASVNENPFLDPTPSPPASSQPVSRGRSRAPRDPSRLSDQSPADPHRKLTQSMSGASNAAQTPPAPPPKSRRSMSQDHVIAAATSIDKQRKAKAPTKKGEKTGLHVDVIDRLDYSGVGPATFHHDGPFDACAPSRNRHRTKAPMLAWTPSQEGGPGQDGILGVPATNNKHLSPLAQATINAMAQSSMGDSPYGAAAAPSRKKNSKDLTAPPPDLDVYYPERPASPKRRETIADAWGKGEPEPFEEFFAGSVGAAVNGNSETGLASAASSIYGGKEGHGSTNGKRRERPIRRPTKNLPPPKPIFPPEAGLEEGATSPDATYTPATSPGYGGAPKRSRSLMHRIKKMREQPNVPVGYEEAPNDGDSSSENHHGARPTHRHQQSLLGKLGNRSPTSPTFGEDEKDLPGLPPSSPRGGDQDGYFSAPNNSGLGRKTSIMQKFRGVVVGKAR